jgi:hypothetical protein
MENKIITRRRALEAALKTVRYQIKHLQPYYSREQIICWEKHRDSLIRQLELLPTEEEVRKNAKNHTALIKSILNKL